MARGSGAYRQRPVRPSQIQAQRETAWPTRLHQGGRSLGSAAGATAQQGLARRMTWRASDASMRTARLLGKIQSPTCVAATCNLFKAPLWADEVLSTRSSLRRQMRERANAM